MGEFPRERAAGELPAVRVAEAFAAHLHQPTAGEEDQEGDHGGLL